MSEKIVIIDNVRSAHNIGSIFRTSDGAGVSKIYLVGSSPTPVDRFGRSQLEIAKTSLGASESVAWEHIGVADEKSADEAIGLIGRLQSEGYTVVAVEQAPDSLSLYDFEVPEKVAYIFGTEVDGVQEQLVQVSDAIIEIPMKGIKESLNVSVAAGIVLFKN